MRDKLKKGRSKDPIKKYSSRWDGPGSIGNFIRNALGIREEPKGDIDMEPEYDIKKADATIALKMIEGFDEPTVDYHVYRIQKIDYKQMVLWSGIFFVGGLSIEEALDSEERKERFQSLLLGDDEKVYDILRYQNGYIGNFTKDQQTGRVKLSGDKYTLSPTTRIEMLQKKVEFEHDHPEILPNLRDRNGEGGR